MNLQGDPKYKDGVTVLLHTLNSEDQVCAVLESIKQSSPDQIIVADGSSTDKTVALAKKYTDDVFVTPPGFHNQQKVAFQNVKFNHLLIIECDQRYPANFIQTLKQELNESTFTGIQAELHCEFQRNFFEKGMASFYRIHQGEKGRKEIIGGPALYHTEPHITYLRHDVIGFGGDARKAELAKKHGITFGLGHTIAYQYQTLNAKQFFKKFFNYGRGDYHFYTMHHKEWTLARKFKSITHIAKRYFFHYPYRALLMFDLNGFFFLILAGIVRYYGWIYEFFTYRKKQP